MLGAVAHDRAADPGQGERLVGGGLDLRDELVGRRVGVGDDLRPRPRDPFGVELGVRLVGLDLDRLVRADPERPQPVDRSSLPCVQVRLDVLRRPAAVRRRRVTNAGIERGEDVALGRREPPGRPR